MGDHMRQNSLHNLRHCGNFRSFAILPSPTAVLSVRALCKNMLKWVSCFFLCVSILDAVKIGSQFFPQKLYLYSRQLLYFPGTVINSSFPVKVGRPLAIAMSKKTEEA